MPKHLTPTFRWVRFSDYEIRKGVVLPKRNATPRWYSPWLDYEAARADKKKAVLGDLVELASGLGPIPTKQQRAGAGELVLAWVRQHGLLGLLPHRLLFLARTPRWEFVQIQYPPPTSQGANGPVAREIRPVQIATYKTNEGWRSVARIAGDVGPRTTDVTGDIYTGPSPKRSARLSYAIFDDDGLPGPGVSSSLSASLSRYFIAVKPSEAEVFNYPSPDTDEFWASYGEPVDDIIETARHFAQALRSTGRAKQRTLGFERLNRLAGQTTPAVSPDLTFDWKWPSLVSCLAFMALTDLSGGFKVRSCAACGRTFVSKAYQAAYCSTTCRFRIQKRSHRRKRKIEK